MTGTTFKTIDMFTQDKSDTHIPVILLQKKDYAGWLEGQDAYTRAALENTSFDGRSGQAALLYSAEGKIRGVIGTLSDPVDFYDLARIAVFLKDNLNEALITGASFGIEPHTQMPGCDMQKLLTGWALAGQNFDLYKSQAAGKYPRLTWPENFDRERNSAFTHAISLVRHLVNQPSNAMGPADLERAARDIAESHAAQISVIQDQDLLRENFPLIYAVGQASPRRPRLIDIRWGNPAHPRLCLVGKGVCFDTGGLDIKPSSNMRLMKKDMGGAAHVLGLGSLIMALKLPVNLRILIPAVENAVGGNAFRPGDIFPSRKGLSVEISNTDAEGRLILADTLTYACEDSPAMIIDFATLTGSARAALGPDIPPFFTNNPGIESKLKTVAFAEGDPLWPMPLWQKYKKHNQSPVADLHNSASVPGDLIYSALFLEQFLTGNPAWVHLDVFAWENSGHPGRPAGGADNGLRAVYAFLEDRFSGEKPTP